MKRYEKKRLSLFLAIIIAIFVFIAFKAISDTTALGINSVLQIPARAVSYVFRTGYELLHFKSIASDNLKLERELTFLRARSASLDSALAENRRLKELLTIKDKLPGPSIAARVTARNLSNFTENLLLDKGSKDGLKEGMAVVANGAIAGRITAVGRFSARVSLVSDPEMRIAVVSDRGRASGLVYGIARARAIMKFIAKDADIKTGDLVLTSNISGVYPAGFIVGSVLDVRTEPNGLYQFAIIEPAAEPMAIEEVLAVE